MEWLNDWIQGMLDPLGWSGMAAVRLCLAALLGGIIGVEREHHGREAGLRTNLLVCLGSALVMLVSARMADQPWGAGGLPGAYNINVDPGRLAYGVMTGIGFLGAGAILKHGTSVQGLTTAAGIWCVAAVGLAAGLGLYVLAILASLLVLIALSILNRMERFLPQSHRRRLTVRIPWEAGCVQKLLHRSVTPGVHVIDHSFRRSHDLSSADVELLLFYRNPDSYDAYEASLLADEGCRVLASERQ